MDLVRARRSHELCVAARNRSGPDRDAFLARLRGEDPALADDVVAMLEEVARLAATTQDDGAALDDLLGDSELQAARHDLQAIAEPSDGLGLSADVIPGRR